MRSRRSSPLLAVLAGVFVLSACGSTADDGDGAGDPVATSDVVTPTAPATPPPTSDPSTPTDPSTPEVGDELPAALTTAGPSGVTVGVPEGSESTIVIEPMAIAATARDGRIFLQRSTDAAEGSDTTLLVWSPETSELTPLDPPLAADSGPDDTVELHDVATVDGAVTVLYTTRPRSCSDPNECIGAVMAWEPDSGESTEIASKIVFEGGWSGLELADNGLVVGAEYESAANAVFLAGIGAASPPTAADLGLEPSYVDCSVCPFAFTIDPSGRYVGWVDSGPGVDQANPPADVSGASDIAVVDLRGDADAGPRRVGVDLRASFGELDIADIEFGNGDGFAAGQAVFTSRASGADAPVRIDLADGRIGPIDATSATLNELDR